MKITHTLLLVFAVALMGACSDSPTEPRITPGFDVSCYQQFCSFQNNSTGGNYAAWIFGDGSPNSTQWQPTHLYPSCERFQARLTICPGPNSAANKCDETSGVIYPCPNVADPY